MSITITAPYSLDQYDQRFTVNYNHGAKLNPPVRVFLDDVSTAGGLHKAAERVVELEQGVKNPPNTPNTCLLYTSPTPRD